MAALNKDGGCAHKQNGCRAAALEPNDWFLCGCPASWTRVANGDFPCVSGAAGSGAAGLSPPSLRGARRGGQAAASSHGHAPVRHLPRAACAPSPRPGAGGAAAAGCHPPAPSPSPGKRAGCPRPAEREGPGCV